MLTGTFLSLILLEVLKLTDLFRFKVGIRMMTHELVVVIHLHFIKIAQDDISPCESGEVE